MNKTLPWEDFKLPAIRLNKVVLPDPLGPIIPVIEPFLIFKEQFDTAQSLLIDFIEQGKPVSESFDTDKMAKYFAIVDLMQAHHSTAWHNMRFYFNPVLNKLEPVGFDGFPTYDSPFLLMSEGALSKHFKEKKTD